MADNNRNQQRNVGQQREQEQQRGRGMEQQRDNMSNTQSPMKEHTSSGMGQQRGSQQERSSAQPGLGSERSEQRGMDEEGIL